MEQKPVILIAAFGSSMSEGQKNLEDADNILLSSFSDYEIYWAFTSRFIVRKLKSRGQKTIFKRMVPVCTLDEVYRTLREKGKTYAFVQGFYMIAGEEYEMVLETPSRGLKVAYGPPLLDSGKNIRNLVEILSSEFGDYHNTATVLCAHGNGRYPENNEQLIEMDKYLRINFKNTYLACMEGPPEFDGVAGEIELSGAKKVKFIPLMLTFGDHMINDVMGDGPDSWKSQLGLESSYADGLASNNKVIDIYVKNIRSCLPKF